MKVKEAELNQLLVLANMESYNAILIGQSMDGIKQLPGGDFEVK